MTCEENTATHTQINTLILMYVNIIHYIICLYNMYLDLSKVSAELTINGFCCCFCLTCDNYLIMCNRHYLPAVYFYLQYMY